MNDVAGSRQMTALQVLTQIERLGGSLSIVDGELHVTAPKGLLKEIETAIEAHKEELFQIVSRGAAEMHKRRAALLHAALREIDQLAALVPAGEAQRARETIADLELHISDLAAMAESAEGAKRPCWWCGKAPVWPTVEQWIADNEFSALAMGKWTRERYWTALREVMRPGDRIWRIGPDTIEVKSPDGTVKTVWRHHG